jgi:hypothetical protein
MTDKPKKNAHSGTGSVSAPVSPETLEENLIAAIPDTPENVARSMFEKRQLPDGTWCYTEEGLRCKNG